MFKGNQALIFIFVLIIFAGCGGGGSEGGSLSPTPLPSPSNLTPEGAISLFAIALKSNDMPRAIDNFVQSDQQRMQEALETLDQESRNYLADALASGTVVEQTEKKVIYSARMDDGSGNLVETRFALFLQNGQWKFLYL